MSYPEGFMETEMPEAVAYTCPNDEKFVYFIADGYDAIKIGIADYVPSRLNSIQSAHAYRLRLLGTESGGLAREQHLHLRFEPLRLRGEWFKAEGELLDYIEERFPSSLGYVDQRRVELGQSSSARRELHLIRQAKMVVDDAEEKVINIISDAESKKTNILNVAKVVAKDILADALFQSNGFLVINGDSVNISDIVVEAENKAKQIVSIAKEDAKSIVNAAKKESEDVKRKSEEMLSWSRKEVVYREQLYADRALIVSKHTFDCRCIFCGGVSANVSCRDDGYDWCNQCWSENMRERISRSQFPNQSIPPSSVERVVAVGL